jgi:hypothetical protein
MKKAILRGLWLTIFIGIFGWASTAICSPIPYNFSEYHHYWGLDGEWLEEYVSQIPPSNFSAVATGSHGIVTTAMVETTFRFIASFQSISIEYDYEYTAYADIGITGAASSSVSLGAYLIDLDTGVKIWSDGAWASGSQIENPTSNEGYGYGPPSGSPGGAGSGTINEILTLIPEHEYELFFSISADSWCWGYEPAFASGEISNLQIDAVPIPSALLLLGSGLIPLALYGRGKVGPPELTQKT